MKKNFFRKICFISLFIFSVSSFGGKIYGQSFSQSNLNFNGKGSISNGTSLMFGPDDRLYLAEYTGAIKIFTIERTSSTDYKVLATETLSDIATIQDHNDDGSLYNSTLRETTGLAVGGTAANPVIYVSSSDFRIGGGGGGGSGDTNLDTNSGVITRFSWNGNSWDVVDLVRGLPRSEENHATNGMELATINGVNYLIVAQGGHTNAGSPSINFAYTSEYALSAAILSINLDMINSMPVKTDNGRKYVYDLPTVDDPTRPNKNGISNPDTPGYNGVDINDPFGGNDGLNQAKIVPGGPVQIFSPGFRNSFDLVLTESGAVYVTENGSNGGWGGFPVNEGGGSATNDYDPDEPGSTITSGGEKVNNKDHLQLIAPDIQNYTFGSFYGGHPDPIRANPSGAGLYTNPSKNGNAGAIFRTKKYHPTKNNQFFTSDPNIGLPADWPPVAVANPVEGDWRGPGIANPDGPLDDIITTWGTNTNGIDEYTASNFNGTMKGNLIAGVNTGVLRRVELKPDGSLSKLTPSFVSGLGGDALGITCNSDSDIFPGTMWVVTLNGKLIVLEPQDFGECKSPGDPGYDANADYDSDGYTNQDEEDNGTDPCNGGSQPNDFDKSDNGPNVSDLNDLDDDGDGISDANDVFQLGDPEKSGSDAFLLPVINELFSSNTELGGYKGLGLTGMMNNGAPNPNWLNWLDRRDDPNDPNENDILGGAIGAMTMQMTSGTASGSNNNQEKGFQYGVQVNANSGKFTVEGGIANFNGPVQLYGTNAPANGELGFFIGDGTQSNYIKFVITPSGLIALQEVNDVAQTPINLSIPIGNRPGSSVSFYFVVNPSNGEVVLKYSFDAGVQVTLGSITAQGTILQSLQNAEKDLAVGMIGTSNTIGVELEGTWDFLNVTSDGPTISADFPDLERTVGAAAENISLVSYFDDNEGVGNLSYSVSGNTNTAIGAVIVGNTLTITYPGSPAVSDITIRATDSDSNYIEQSFKVSVVEEQVVDQVLYRVNSGGPAITAIDGKLDWGQDTKANKSAYLSQAGKNNTYASGGMTSYNVAVDQTTTPVSIYNTERYDSEIGAPNMTYAFPVDKPGNYEVRLYMGNSYSGTATVGKRIFDISIEGVVYPSHDNIDLSARFGHQVGGVIIKEVEVTDGLLEISLIHGAIENPLINGIEILGVATGGQSTPIQVTAIADQVNSEGDVLDGSLAVSASGGDGNLTYSMSGAPSGVSIEPTNGQIGGTINSGTAANSPYTVTITVDDSDGETSDAVIRNFSWEISEQVEKWIDKNESENYTARHECSFVQAGDKFYLLGGRENAKTIDVYDYTSNSWESLVGSAPFEFNHFQATEYQGLIWVVGAFGDNGFPTEVPEEFIWAFNPTSKKWIKGPLIPSGRQRGSAGLVIYNDKFYIVGGNTDGHNGGAVAWFDEYDPATGIWTPLIDAPRARDHFHAAIVGDKLYAIGGRLSGGNGGTFKPVIPEVDVFNFTNNSWTTLPSSKNLPTPRAAASVVNFNDKLLVIGGEVENENVYGENIRGALHITEQYDPLTGNWKRVKDLNHERHGTQAIVSGQGVFTLAGSPQLGGGSQKNMEYLGVDAPTGSPGIAGSLIVPSEVQVSKDSDTQVSISVNGGNIGKLITSMEITGTNKENFVITSGNLSYGLLKPNSNYNVHLNFLGNTANETANLVIYYDSGESATVALQGILTNNLKSNVSEVAMYPNPAVDDVTIEISDPSLIVQEIYVYSSNGILLRTFTYSNLDKSGKYNFNVSGLPSGVYIVKLNTNKNEVINLNLIVSK